MLTQTDIKQEAERLHRAEKERIQISATTTRFPQMEISDSYAIQKQWMELKKEEGRTVIGHKIGLTSHVMQVAMGIDEPDYGTLLDDMVFENFSKIRTQDFLDPKIEVELAFVLKKRIFGINVSVEEVLDATDYIIPSLELIAARSFRKHPETGYTRTVRDTISDNAANGGIITGGRKMKPGEVDLRWASALLYKNDVIVESGVAAAVLDNPVLGVVWLAKKYAQHNVALEPGQLILSGSFTRPVDVAAGDSIVADYGILGKIECEFV